MLRSIVAVDSPESPLQIRRVVSCTVSKARLILQTVFFVCRFKLQGNVKNLPALWPLRDFLNASSYAAADAWKAEHIFTRRLIKHGTTAILAVLCFHSYIWFGIPPVFNFKVFTNKLNTTVPSSGSRHALDEMMNCRPALFLLSIFQWPPFVL